MITQKLLHLICVMGAVLNFAPHYDLKNRKVCTSIYSKIGAIIKIACLLVVHVISLHGRLQYWYGKSSIILNILDVLLFAAEGAVTVLVLWVSAFGNLKDWEKFLTLAINKTYRKGELQKYLLFFFVAQLCPLALIAVNGWVWTNSIGFSTYKYYLIRDVELYHNYIFFFSYINMVMVIRSEFRDANNLLIDMVKGIKTKQVEDQGRFRLIRLNQWGIDDITRMATTYRTIYEATESINNIFGWEILFFMGHTACVMLNLLYTSVWLVDRDVFEDDDKAALLCMNAVMAISTTVRNTIKIVS